MIRLAAENGIVSYTGNHLEDTTMDPLYIIANAIAEDRKHGRCFTAAHVDVRFQRMTDGSVTMKAQTGHGAVIRRIARPAGSVEQYGPRFWGAR